MLCQDLECKQLGEDFFHCRHYPSGYQSFVTRQGYCPVIDDGPNKLKHAVEEKRVGAQKTKKKK